MWDVFAFGLLLAASGLLIIGIISVFSTQPSVGIRTRIHAVAVLFAAFPVLFAAMFAVSSLHVDIDPDAAPQQPPAEEAVAQPVDNTPTEPRNTCHRQLLTYARNQFGVDNVRSVEVRGATVVVSYFRNTSWTVGWTRTALVLEAMDLMKHAYAEPTCSQILSVGVISYLDFIDKFGQDSEGLASEMWLDRDIAERIKLVLDQDDQRPLRGSRSRIREALFSQSLAIAGCAR